MPTGYTAMISEGATFERFALSCARQFGALIMMRDEPYDAEIPEFQPTDYHTKQLEADNERLTWLKSLTAAQVQDQCEKAHNEEVERIHKMNAEKDITLAKYEEMLEKVNAWVPPTEDHLGLKEFMVKQITESIYFDCSNYDFPKRITPDDWRIRELKKVMDSITYHTVEHEKDVQRTNSRNEWVKKLKLSLQP